MFTLPSPTAIKRMLKGIECSPGFLDQLINQIGKDIQDGKHGPDAVLLHDGMNIRSCMDWDPGIRSFIGLAKLIEEPSIPCLANSALVFYLVGLDGRWKLPIAWFLTKGFTAEELRVALNVAFRKLDDAGISVRGVVFDGFSANVAAVQSSGAKLDPQNLVSFILHPSNRRKNSRPSRYLPHNKAH